MDGKVLGLLLFGLFLASSGAHGHNGTDHSAQPVCNMTTVFACYDPFTSGGQLNNFADFDKKPKQEQETIMQMYNKTTIRDICSGFRAVGDCLRAEEERCFNLSDPNTEVDFSKYTGGIHLETSRTMYGAVHEFCSEKTDCLYDIWECLEPHSEMLKGLENHEGLFNSTQCQTFNETTHCIKRHVPKQCHLVPDVKLVYEALELSDSICYTSTCPGVMACLIAFQVGQPAMPMDANTCFLYANYTGCVGRALAECPSIQLPEGQTPFSKIMELITESCNEMQHNGRLFGCPAFADCVGEDDTTVFVPRFCPSFQKVTHCAAKSVYNATCSVNASSAQAFVTKANALVQKGAGFGCGRAQIVTKGCAGLMTCMQHAEDIYDNDDFHKVCSGMVRFESCADTAMENCGLTPTPPEGATVRFPRLSVLSNITNKVCTAMQNATLTTCHGFNQCLAGNKQPKEIVNGQAWCLYSLQTLECGRSFSDNCQTPEDLKNNLAQIYEEYLNAGCQNVFGYVYRTTTAPPDPNQTDPTQGAQSLVGLSLAWMLLLSLLHLL